MRIVPCGMQAQSRHPRRQVGNRLPLEGQQVAERHNRTTAHVGSQKTKKQNKKTMLGCLGSQGNTKATTKPPPLDTAHRGCRGAFGPQRSRCSNSTACRVEGHAVGLERRNCCIKQLLQVVLAMVQRRVKAHAGRQHLLLAAQK